MTSDPKVRKDGTCARKGCGKILAIKRNPKVTDHRLMIDPFCSSACCRLYYGLNPHRTPTST